MPLPAPVPVHGIQEQGYRMRARLHAKDGMFGFFREGTHELCDAGPTRQLLPDNDRCVASACSLSCGGRALTSCELSENAAATERACCSNWTPSATTPLHVDPIEGISGLLFVDHQRGILTVSYGSPYVTRPHSRSPTASVALTHHVQSFFQGNRYLLPELVSRVLAQVPEGTVTDLYAGVGLFAVSLAAQGHEADCRGRRRPLERARSRVECRSRTARRCTCSISRLRAICSGAASSGLTRSFSILRGRACRREAMSGILGLKSRALCIVSCDPATLARDVKRFSEVGYRLDHIEAFDLFPNTAHVETLAVLTREPVSTQARL